MSEGQQTSPSSTAELSIDGAWEADIDIAVTKITIVAGADGKVSGNGVFVFGDRTSDLVITGTRAAESVALQMHFADGGTMSFRGSLLSHDSIGGEYYTGGSPDSTWFVRR